MLSVFLLLSVSVDMGYATTSQQSFAQLRRRSLFAPSNEDIHCTSCLNRRSKTIKAFYHGHQNDPFWQPIVAAANRAGEEQGVSLETKLYDSVDNSAQMAADIRSVVQRRHEEPVDALILSVPSEMVRDAAWEATRVGIPVFGMNCGWENEYDTTLEMSAWVGQDDYQAGRMAAERFLQTQPTINKAIFINHEPGTRGMQMALLMVG